MTPVGRLEAHDHQDTILGCLYFPMKKAINGYFGGHEAIAERADGYGLAAKGNSSRQG